MDISILEIRSFMWQGTVRMGDMEGETHRKTLPMLSVVQAVEGYYEFGMNGVPPGQYRRSVLPDRS